MQLKKSGSISNMKCRDVEYLLVELADGTISAEGRTLIETHLVTCASCAADAVLLNETFSALRTETAEAPPEHYFTNLLPTIRKRLENTRQPWHVAVPLWLNNLLAPLTVTAMAVTVFGLFRLFEPSEEFSPLQALVGQVPTDEISALVSPENDPFDTDGGISGSAKVLELLPNPNRVADRMKAEFLADELPLVSADVTNLSDDTSLEDMDDDAVSQVLNRMNDGSTL
jgi:hypothetical protein